MTVLSCCVSYLLSVTNKPFQLSVVMLNVVDSRNLIQTLNGVYCKITSTRNRPLRQPENSDSLKVFYVYFRNLSIFGIKICKFTIYIANTVCPEPQHLFFKVLFGAKRLSITTFSIMTLSI